MQTALYFDPVNSLRGSGAGARREGFIDTPLAPAGIWTALNQIPSQKSAGH